jgi:hypothetical protein
MLFTGKWMKLESMMLKDKASSETQIFHVFTPMKNLELNKCHDYKNRLLRDNNERVGERRR